MNFRWQQQSGRMEIKCILLINCFPIGHVLWFLSFFFLFQPVPMGKQSRMRILVRCPGMARGSTRVGRRITNNQCWLHCGAAACDTNPALRFARAWAPARLTTVWSTSLTVSRLQPWFYCCCHSKLADTHKDLVAYSASLASVSQYTVLTITVKYSGSSRHIPPDLACKTQTPQNLRGKRIVSDQVLQGAWLLFFFLIASQYPSGYAKSTVLVLAGHFSGAASTPVPIVEFHS